MDRETGMFIRKEYSIIALAEAMKRGSDQRKARFLMQSERNDVAQKN